MFKVETPDKVFYFWFTHVLPAIKHSALLEEMLLNTPEPVAAGTGCEILSGPPGSLKKDCTKEAVAFAKLYFKDEFSRAKGRKFALAKVLKHYPKDFRKLVWEAYFLTGTERP